MGTTTTSGVSGVSAITVPAAFDWRTQSGLPPIRDQAACGSCWAFSTVGALECAIKIKDGVVADLSEQWLISDNQEGWGCGGGWFAHDYHLRGSAKHDPYGDNGAVPETAFPYVAQDVAPNGPYPHIYWLDNWAYIGTGSTIPTVDEIKSAIMAYGPISVGVYANSAFQAYVGGVFNNNDNKTINHAVVLVGWDDTQGSNGVWILRNSWGAGWGEGGYMRIQYGCSSVGYAANFVNYLATVGLQVNPSDGLSATGPLGGAFSPATKTYTVRNSGAHDILWSASSTQPWISLGPGSGSLSSGGQTTVTVNLNSTANSLAAGSYSGTVTITNLTDHDVQTRPVTLRVGQADYFTEWFDTTPNDLGWKAITFTPDSSPNGYVATRIDITAFPTDPTNGTRLALADDGYAALRLTNGMQVALYGTRYSTIYVGANGYLTFNTGDHTYSASLANHFSQPRISALFEDLNPAAGGTVSWKQLTDHVAITFQNVPEYKTTNKNNFQIELFTNGVIRLSYLNLDTTRGLVGLSRGTGVPADYQASDLSTYPAKLTPSVSLTVLANPATDGTVVGGGTYAAGAQPTITAIANGGWKFTNWSDGNTSNPRTLLMASNVTLTANFTVAKHFYLQDATGNVTKWAGDSQGLLQPYDSLGNLGGWKLKAAGTVAHGGQADLFWQMASGWVAAWLSTATNNYTGVQLGNLGAWELRAVADVDGDGTADLIWQNPDGWVVVWYMKADCTPRSVASLGNLGGWRLKAAGDVNGDGRADLFWQQTNGWVTVWLSAPNNSYTGPMLGNLGLWELRAIIDVDGDGIPDLVWQHPSGWTAVWYMNSNCTPRAGASFGNTGAAKIMAVE